MADLEEQLKNPVWYSLKETHKKHVVQFDGVKFYDPKISTFGSFLDESKTLKASNTYLKSTNDFFFVSENQTPIVDDANVVLTKKINGCQMVLDKLIDSPITEDIVLLDKSFINEIYDLVWLIMPGYYQKRTFDMGNYYGIFKDRKLISITGQRMQTNHFIEISSVVTHPDFTGKGFARQLITHTTKEIIKENKTPILHTNKGNLAIPLYEKIGYKVTRDMNWWLYHRK